MDKILTATKSKKRMKLLSLFSIFQELNLGELADLMYMSKTAVHHHLQILRDCGLIEVSREEKSRGSIDTKYFRLSTINRRFFVEDLDKIANSKARFRSLKSMVKAMRYIFSELIERIELSVSYLQMLDRSMSLVNEENIEITHVKEFQLDLLQHNTHLRYIHLNEDQLISYKKLESEFLDKVDILIDGNIPMERPYLAIVMDMPIKNLLRKRMN